MYWAAIIFRSVTRHRSSTTTDTITGPTTGVITDPDWVIIFVVIRIATTAVAGITTVAMAAPILALATNLTSGITVSRTADRPSSFATITKRVRQKIDRLA